MKIKPTLVGFKGEQGSMLSFVLIKTQNATIPTMKSATYNFKPVF